MYNTEKYLVQCVDSILAQTYRNLEVILVDDGSTDSCPAMCDDYARKDERVKVIHKPNGGQSTARNKGLDVARGKYIGFIDSDDSIKPEMYMRLYELLTENDADISMCEMYRFDETGQEVIFPAFRNEVVTGTENILEHYVLPEHEGSYGNPVNKLYKSEIWTNMRFKEGYIHEDTIIVHRILGLCKRIVTSDEQLYLRLMRHDSTMGSLKDSFQIKSFCGHAYAFTDLYSYLMDMGRPDLADYALRSLFGQVKYALRNVNYFQYKREISGPAKDTFKRLVRSPKVRNKLRAVKLALMWLRSIFRPFIGKEKIL